MAFNVICEGKTYPVKRFPVGSPNNWTPELGLKRGGKEYAFAKDSFFQVEHSLYQTDTTCARVKRVWSQLKREKALRHTSQQRRVGKLVRERGDDGGHLISSAHGGSGQAINMVPMSSLVNRAGGAWYAMEKDAARYLSRCVSVHMVIEINYSDATTLRPSSFSVWLVCLNRDKTTNTYFYRIAN